MVRGEEMYAKRVSGDLVLEVWPGGEGDRPLVKLRSLTMERDGDPDAVGVVVVYPEEVDALMAALTDAAAAIDFGKHKEAKR